MLEWEATQEFSLALFFHCKDWPEYVGRAAFTFLLIQDYNKNQKEDSGFEKVEYRAKSYLLPMAFSHGSPVHNPSFGSGHPTVAGGCVTELKAFFDESYKFPRMLAVKPGGDEFRNDAYKVLL